MFAQTEGCLAIRPPKPLKTLVLGLGNPLLTDDAVGLQVVQRLRPELVGWPSVEVDEDYWGGLRLMERMIGFERAILVDAICSGTEAGTIHVLSLADIPSRHSGSAHDMDLGTALALGRHAGAALPAEADIRLVAIEADDVLTFNGECTPRVRANIQRAAETVLELLAAWR